jgi:uncharacterized protein YkvS
MATIKDLLSTMIGKINENTSSVDVISEEIADLKKSGIIVVQNGNTLTIEGGEE